MKNNHLGTIQKTPSCIEGFDIIARGGIPKGRTTLVSGSSGSGKTIFCAQFLYGGVMEYGENAVFVTFEERPDDIIRNMKSFGWSIDKLVKEKKWAFVDTSSDDSQSTVVGNYDLGAFLVRIEYAIKKVNAKRVAVDSISALFPRYGDTALLRRELYNITSRLKKIGVTAIMTAERPMVGNEISRWGVEEFVSDNVILLHNILDQRKSRERSIEILKFRGTSHETTTAPLIVTENGIEVFPLPNPQLTGKGSAIKITTGIEGLDKMLFGGVYKISTTLISGSSGTGKTVTALHFIIEGAKRGENSVFIEFEESPEQLYRNANSFGWDFEKYVKSGKIDLVCHYPEDWKAEQYLKVITNLVTKTKATRVVLDSLSALERIYEPIKFREFVIGLNAILKSKGITSIFTNTTSQFMGMSQITESHLSTATDNIIILKYVEIGGSMRRLLSVLKARGSNHVKELTEFEIGNRGVKILGPFKDVENLMSGSAKKIQIRFDEGEHEKMFLKELN